MRNTMEHIKKELKVGDLEPTHLDIVNAVGLDKYIELCLCFGGTTIYIPMLKTIQAQVIKRKICESRPLVRAKAVTVNQLAKLYGVSARTVYCCLKGDE